MLAVQRQCQAQFEQKQAENSARRAYMRAFARVWESFHTSLAVLCRKRFGMLVGHSQYHLAVAGGYVVDALDLLMFRKCLRRTHLLPQVVLTRSKRDV